MLKVLGCPEGCLEAIGNVDLFEDIVEVGLHGMRTEVELIGNLIIGGPYGDQGKYLGLP